MVKSALVRRTRDDNDEHDDDRGESTRNDRSSRGRGRSSSRNDGPAEFDEPEGETLIDIDDDNCICANISEFQGAKMLEIRKWFRKKNGGWIRTRNGLSIKAAQAVALKESLSDFIESRRKGGSNRR